MKSILFLEKDDIIHPDDYCRPLIRSADYSSYSDAWIEINEYGGSPLDTLKWMPLWLKFGECWWGKTYQEITDQSNIFYEYVRGELPKSHIIDLKENNFYQRHPLWWETFSIEKEEFLKSVWPFKKYKGKKVKKILEDDFEYVNWIKNNVHCDFAEKLKKILDAESSIVYYKPVYKKFILKDKMRTFNCFNSL